MSEKDMILVESVDTNNLSIEEVKNIAKEMFSSTETDFNDIKNRPWYRKFLNTITLGIKDRKVSIKNVRNLANLQTLFLTLYMSQEITHDEELDSIVESVQVVSDSVVALHRNCVIKLSTIESPYTLCEDDQQVLLWFLTLSNEGDFSNEQKDKFQNYNLHIRKACKVSGSEERPLEDMLKNVNSPKVFYRCASEQSYYIWGDFRYTESMKNALAKLAVSEDDKDLILKSIKKEVENYSGEVLVQKYQEIDGMLQAEWFDLEEKKEEINDERGQSTEKIESKVIGYEYIIECIKKYTKTEKLGKSLIKTDTDKEKQLVKLIPTILPKTVADILKTDNGNLLFTTYAVYIFEKDEVKQIKYKDLSEEKIGIDFSRGTLTFEVNSTEKIILNDKKIDNKELQDLFCDLIKIGDLPESDTAVPVKEMSDEVKERYMKLLYYVVSASKCEDYEIYKKANEYGVTSKWEEIKNAVRDDREFKTVLSEWKESLMYPSEESTEVQMIVDICKVIQYTRNNDTIPTTSEKYFNQICGFDKYKEDSIISYALSEKQSIEKRISFDAYKKVLEVFAVALGGIGISVAAYSSIFTMFWTVWWFNLIPGFGTILTAGLTGGSLIKSTFDQKRNKKFNEEELRVKLYKDEYEAYIKAIEDAKEREYDKIANLLENAQSQLSQAANITYKVEIVDDAIYEDIREKVIGYIKNTEIRGKIFSDLTAKEQNKLLNDMVIPGVVEDKDDVIGYFNPNVFFVITRSSSGLLFVKKGFYYKAKPSSHIMYIPYCDIRGVNESNTSLELFTRDGKYIKLKDALYKSFGLSNLFNSVSAMYN
ncbi:hypothetical protein [Petroclostridium sp. X23]|uniref:hypothetical protein n=1 Tax=Petroclostridium sp. X23 TaxID=3045146 RepID=UPI0024ACBC4D|nr:hypothetical protein [Petroclostridium sp. X23]WHH60967.1 hypothetical protein QKW49_09780 [Petroclostridium sp. X23]